MARLRRLVSNGPIHGIGRINVQNANSITQPEDILTHLIDTHFPDSTAAEDHAGTHMGPQVHAEGHWVRANSIVTWDRLGWAINSFDRYKSPGPDGIFPALLQEGGSALRSRLLGILRASVALGYISEAWRKVRVVFIPNPGKNCYDTAKAFRPICLSSFLLKTLERLFDRHLKENELMLHPLHTARHAYQEGKSTETALHTLVGKIERRIQAKEASLCVFIDIEGAFDNTNFNVIEAALHRIHTQLTIIRWILNMLRLRTVEAFTRNWSMKVRPPCIYGVPLSFTNHVKYLGVWLDHKLSWSRQIEMQTNKVIRTYWACRRMFGIGWGLEPRIVRCIFTAILLPQFCYASLVWWPALGKKCNTRRSDMVGRLAGLGITGALRTTPSLPLLMLTGITPPHVAAQQLAMGYAIRLWGQGVLVRAKSGHASLLGVEGPLNDLLSVGYDEGRKRFHPGGRLKMKIPPREEWSRGGTNLLTPEGPVWCTDGSKSAEGSGGGIWSDGPRTAVAFSFGEHLTVAQTEMAALSECVKRILERGYSRIHIHICCDSKETIRALSRTCSRSVQLNECVDRMNLLTKENWLHVTWVPGHSGIRGNEEANRLAQEGANRRPETSEMKVGIHPSILKTRLVAWSNEQTLHAWHEAPGMRHTKALLNGPSVRLAEKLIDLPRRDLRLMVGMITGRWPTRAYRARCNKDVQPLCWRCGHAEETSLHLLTRCTELDDPRWTELGTSCPKIVKVKAENVGASLALPGLPAYT
uniref:RNase H type-1 domain-containing protein n=1 Tax=Bracon brevicornis TaxID=1563983 RepID=A0A6V7LAJ9_9HYME